MPGQLANIHPLYGINTIARNKQRLPIRIDCKLMWEQTSGNSREPLLAFRSRLGINDRKTIRGIDVVESIKVCGYDMPSMVDERDANGSSAPVLSQSTHLWSSTLVLQRQMRRVCYFLAQ
jgi:hypothetical protein